MNSDSSLLADLVQRVQEQSEVVSFVETLVDVDLPARPVAVKIQFAKVSICIFARGADDTVAVSSDWPGDFDDDMTEVCKPEALGDLLRDARLNWCWLMQNHLGFLDGIQLEFARGREDELACIQFIAIGSTLELRMVRRP